MGRWWRTFSQIWQFPREKGGGRQCLFLHGGSFAATTVVYFVRCYVQRDGSQKMSPPPPVFPPPTFLPEKACLPVFFPVPAFCQKAEEAMPQMDGWGREGWCAQCGRNVAVCPIQVFKSPPCPCLPSLPALPAQPAKGGGGVGGRKEGEKIKNKPSCHVKQLNVKCLISHLVTGVRQEGAKKKNR